MYLLIRGRWKPKAYTLPGGEFWLVWQINGEKTLQKLFAYDAIRRVNDGTIHKHVLVTRRTVYKLASSRRALLSPREVCKFYAIVCRAIARTCSCKIQTLIFRRRKWKKKKAARSCCRIRAKISRIFKRHQTVRIAKRGARSRVGVAKSDPSVRSAFGSSVKISEPTTEYIDPGKSVRISCSITFLPERFESSTQKHSEYFTITFFFFFYSPVFAVIVNFSFKSEYVPYILGIYRIY